MLNNHKTSTAFLIFSILFCGHTEALRVVKFKGGNSRFSPAYFSNFSLDTQKDVIFVNLTVIKPLVAGFKANLAFQLRLNNSKSYQTLFAYTLDVCSLIISLKDSIFKKWFQSLLKYGNFMQNCPVPKGHYYLNGWTIEPNMVPSYLYPGDYRIKGYGYMGKFKSKNEVFIVQLELDAIIS